MVVLRGSLEQNEPPGQSKYSAKIQKYLIVSEKIQELPLRVLTNIQALQLLDLCEEVADGVEGIGYSGKSIYEEGL